MGTVVTVTIEDLGERKQAEDLVYGLPFGYENRRDSLHSFAQELKPQLFY